MWSPPLIVAGDLEVSENGDLMIVAEQPNTSTSEIVQGSVFLIEDVAALGHMQMSFTALFSFLVAQPSGTNVMLAWECGESNPIRTIYYEPLLRLLKTHFARHKRLTFETIPAKAGHHYRTRTVTVRRCMTAGGQRGARALCGVVRKPRGCDAVARLPCRGPRCPPFSCSRPAILYSCCCAVFNGELSHCHNRYSSLACLGCFPLFHSCFCIPTTPFSLIALTTLYF